MLEALRDGVFLSPYDAFQQAAREAGLSGQVAIRNAAQCLAEELRSIPWSNMHLDYAAALHADAGRLADLAMRQLSIMQDV